MTGKHGLAGGEHDVSRGEHGIGTAPTIVAAGLITGPDGRLLITRRTRPEQLAGLWEFPGGKVEPGEGTTEALVREIDEELDLPIDVGTALRPPPGIATAQGFWPISDRLQMITLFATAPTTAVRLSPAHDRHRWCTSEELAALPTCDWVPADRGVVAELLSLRESGAARGDTH